MQATKEEKENQWEVGCGIDVLFRDEHSAASDQHTDWLLVPVLMDTTVKRIFFSALRDALIYRHKYKYLGGSLIPCPFSRTIVECS